MSSRTFESGHCLSHRHYRNVYIDTVHKPLFSLLRFMRFLVECLFQFTEHFIYISQPNKPIKYRFCVCHSGDILQAEC